MKQKLFFILLIVLLSVFRVGAQDAVPRLGEPTLLQHTLNELPAISIAGNNLDFEFGGDTWIAKLNGRDFMAGNVMSYDIDEGVILVLTQTHSYPPRDIPGIRWIRTPGPEIILEYKIGPPVSFSQISRSGLPVELLQDENFMSNIDNRSTQDTNSNQRNDSPSFGGSIFASFEIGGAPIAENRYGWVYGINLMFVANNGLTISGQANNASYGTIFGDMDENDERIHLIDVFLGIGYVYYNNYYIGGILNLAKGNSEAFCAMAPTLVGGYDFGGIFLGGQLSYLMYTKDEKRDGVKFSLGVGVSIR
jgi:hypothetical protein